MSEKVRIKNIRQKVIQRDGLICCYCEEFLLLKEVTMDHIVPVSQRGTFNATNLTVACESCNGARKSKHFFDYCKKFNWSDSKLKKYRKLYEANLNIKILNIAKEFYIIDPENVIPSDIIKKACKKLKVKQPSFQKYFKEFDISLDKSYVRKKIKFSFEEIIKIIENETL